MVYNKGVKKRGKNMKIENLTTAEIIDIIKGLKKGSFHSFTRKHVENNGYYFVRKYVGRFASYSSLIGKENDSTDIIGYNNNGKITIIPSVLYYNESTKNYLLMVATTKNTKHHSKTTYYNDNGEIITQEQYEMVNPPKKNYNKAPLIVFTLKLNELVEVK